MEEKEKILSGSIELIKEYPQYRWGQAVFNYVDEHYNGIAREVQFIDGVDCFYNDDNVDDFLNHVCYRIFQNKNK